MVEPSNLDGSIWIGGDRIYANLKLATSPSTGQQLAEGFYRCVPAPTAIFKATEGIPAHVRVQERLETFSAREAEASNSATYTKVKRYRLTSRWPAHEGS